VSTPTLDDHLAQFEQGGYTAPIRVRDDAEATLVRKQWDQVESAEGLPTPDRLLMYNRHRNLPFILELASDERVLDIVESLIGPNILLFGTRVICKWPGDEEFVAWHQDVSERNQLTPPVQITGWYAVDDSTVENGCVEVLPASHRRGMLPRQPASYRANLLRQNEETVVSEADQALARPVELQAGEMSLHHGFTLHRSGTSPSARRRCGFVMRYVPAEVQQGPDVEVNQRETAVLLRGVDPHAKG